MTMTEGCSSQYDTLGPQRTGCEDGTRGNSPDSLRPMRDSDSSGPPPNNFFRRRLMSFDDADCHADGKMGHVDPKSGIRAMLSIAEARSVGGGGMPFADGCCEVSRECVEATLREVALSRALDADGAAGSPLTRRRSSIHESPALEAKGRSSHQRRRRHSSEMVLDEISSKHIPVNHPRHSRHLHEGRASEGTRVASKGVEHGHSAEPVPASAFVGSSKNLKDVKQRQELAEGAHAYRPGESPLAVPLNQVSPLDPNP